MSFVSRECDLIFAGLKAFGNYTYKVTMLFLNFFEKYGQKDMVQCLPQLHKDLQDGNLDTLKDYKIEWTHIDMLECAPSTD